MCMKPENFGTETWKLKQGFQRHTEYFTEGLSLVHLNDYETEIFDFYIKNRTLKTLQELQNAALRTSH